jgi:beta-mannanase/regulation of enolase protein 1 (concanavalin A-like superfamily)
MNQQTKHYWKFLTKNFLFLFLVIAMTNIAFAQKFNPGANKTILLVGQTYKSEYEGYVNGVGTKPAGSSHYGTLYQGTIEQGDDNPNGNFLDFVRNYQSNPYALVALSLKDNTAAGGYGQMVTPNVSDFNSNAVHDALVAVNNGQWDAKIDAYANGFKSRSDVKFFVRIDYEVSLLLFAYNGSQFFDPWLQQKAQAGINVFENPDTVPEMERQAYINAYNRIANRIKAIATNVAFVYHPVRGYNDTRWLYPGDQNVDYVAFSIFNNDICMEVNGTFNCAGQTVDPQLQQSMNFAKQHGKAIMIAESAVQAPASKTPAQFNLYLERLNNLIVANDVKVVSYINSNWPIHGWDANWGDSRVEVNPTVKSYWNSTFLGSRYVQGSGTVTGGGALPSGWSTSDIGSVTPAGSATYSNGTFSLNGSGADIWGNNDAFRFAYQNVSGNVRITAKVNSISNTNAWAKAGVMIRDGVGTNAINSAIVVTPAQGVSFQNRTTTGGASTNNAVAGTAPEWLRLERVGNIITSFRSEDGSAWTQVGTTTIAFGTNALVGLSVTSHNNGTGADATFSNVIIESIGTVATAPLAPSNIVATTISSTQINLSWIDNATNETGYYVERATGTGAFTQIASLGANTTSYSSTGLTASTNYAYRVRAYNVAGNSTYSNTANGTTTVVVTTNCAGTCPPGFTLSLCGRCWVDQAQATQGGCTETCTPTATVPTAPLNLATTVVSSTQINLTWTDNSNNETGFLIEQSTGTGAFTQIASVGAGVVSYNSTGLTSNTSYNYRVIATNATGNSVYSNTSTKTTLTVTTTAPVAPSALVATVSSNTQINLTWADNSNNETGFLVERSTGTGVFAQIASLGAGVTSYNSTGLTANTIYNYRVRATNNIGNSGYSNTATKTTTNSTITAINGKFAPPAGKTLMIIGQDLASISNYVTSSEQYPTPSGVTTYISFFDILNQGGGYGALGMLPNGQTPGASIDLDWGGGPLNSYSTATAWPNSALQIGLNISEYANSQGFLAQLGNGQKDAEINQLAVFFKKISPKPVYLRIGYEFDGQWNAGYQNQTNYINAFRRIVTVLRNQGVTNVAYVWQSCSSPIDDIIENKKEDINGWYPGDTYVDWVGLSWFLLPTETPSVGGNPANQIALANEVVQFGRSHNKPVMIAEATPQGYNIAGLNTSNISTVWDGVSGGNTVGKTPTQIWNEWFVPFFNYIRTNSDAIRAVSYINANWNAQGLWAPPYLQGYWGDTRVQANATISANWKNEINTSFWLNGGPTLFSQLSSGTAKSSTDKSLIADDLQVEFYPNPNATGTLSSFGLKVGMECKITNALGKEVFNKYITTDDESLDISKLSAGMYFVDVIFFGKSTVKKIIVN